MNGGLLIGTLAVGAGAVAQAVTGIGFSLVCAPILIATAGSHEGVRLVNTLAAMINVLVLIRGRRDVRVRDAASLLVPAVIATPLLAVAVRHVPGRTLAIAAGVLPIGSAAALASGLRLHIARGRVGAAGAGIVSATMNVIGGIGGPAAAMYAYNADWPASSTRSTLQVFFLVLNVVTVASLGLPQLHLVYLLGLVGGLAIGVAISRRVEEHHARAVTLVIAAAGGAVAIIRAVI